MIVGKEGTHQYITYVRSRNPEVFFVEGSYNETFKDACLKPLKARWDPQNKRWEVQKEHLHQVKQEAIHAFDTVYYGEGGDYIKL